MQWKSAGMPVQSAQAGAPSSSPGSRRCWAQPGQVPCRRVARW
ncbi:hypothetical protein ACFFX0_04815 [Citricoccus parietis]|uniref:Uncharacterized protein n=1 Tax=Citricoccus parietis TaxID=592307 RepID=A0ABV5FW85_9MICC